MDIDKELEDLMKELGVEDDAVDATDATGAAGQAVPSAAAEADASSEVVDEIKRLRAELLAKQQEESSAQKEEEPAAPTISNEELGNIAAYRDKLEKLAKAAVGDELKAIREELKRLQELQQRATQATFASMLHAAVPDIDTLTADPEFQKYMKEKAPLSGGRTIGELLAAAYDAQNIAQVQEIVSTFKARQGEQKPQVTPLPSAEARPPIQEAPATPTEPTTGDANARLQKIWEARERVLEAYRKKQIDYEKYLSYVQRLDEQEAMLTSQVKLVAG